MLAAPTGANSHLATSSRPDDAIEPNRDLTWHHAPPGTRGEKTMPNATTEFFEGLNERGHDPLLEKASGAIRFDLETNKGIDHWYVQIENGDVRVSQKNGKADCVLRTDATVFEGMAEGRVNATAASLRGVVAAEGDLSLLIQFQRLFPGPPTSHRPAATTSSGRESA
jgi:putative sterol carrier protein